VRKRSVSLLFVVVTGSLLSIVMPGAAGASVTAGSAVITKPAQASPLDSGGSTTLYGVWLPADARCSGDTEHKQFHIFTFMFPRGVAPTDVSFKTGVPDGFGTNGRLGFFSDGQYVGALNTAPGSGQVVGLPESYTWTRLTPKYLFTGGETTSAWDGGIACANRDGVVTNYWDTQIVFRASSADPGGFTWFVPKSAQTALVNGSSSPVGIVLVVVAGVLAVIAVLMSRRRRSEGHHVLR